MKKLINLWPSIKHKHKINVKIILHYHYNLIKINIKRLHLKTSKNSIQKTIQSLIQKFQLFKNCLLSKTSYQRSSTRARRAPVGGVPLLRKSTHPRKFGNHVTDRPTDRPSAPQAYQCLLSHFLATLGAQEKADVTSMLSSIDSCQNRVSADHYHLTESRAEVSTHRGRVFFEVIR